jgi:hypothetical protein
VRVLLGSSGKHSVFIRERVYKSEKNPWKRDHSILMNLCLIFFIFVASYVIYLFCFFLYLSVAGWKIRLPFSKVKFLKMESQGMWTSLVKFIKVSISAVV